jgi:hypothetical protein
MNDVDDRLAAWNPVPAQDLLQASSSADAAQLLNRVLSQPPATSPRRHAFRSSRPAWGWIAAAAAAVTIAAIAATLPSQPPPAGQAVTGFDRGPSMGVADNAVQLVDFAARSAALAPVFVPGQQDWAYFETYFGPTAPGGPESVGVSQTWNQVGTASAADSWDHGKLTYGAWADTSQLTGWPIHSLTGVYQYLASLPAQPAALRKIILANNHGDPAAAFTAVEGIFGNFPVSARFQAELYGVLAGLPGVHFTLHAVDAAGRPGVGLYIVHDGYIDAGDNTTRKVTEVEEVIVNPRTYVYMGGLLIAVRGHLPYDTLLAHPGSGTILESAAVLNSGIVSRPGQLPQP